jgi:hypothetical protein
MKTSSRSQSVSACLIGPSSVRERLTGAALLGQDSRVADGDHLGVRRCLVHLGQHLDALVLDPGELVLNALLSLGRAGAVPAAGFALCGSQFQALEEHAAEGQAVAADTDGDDVGLVFELCALDLWVDRGPATGGLDRADRTLSGCGDVGDGGVAAADVAQVDGLVVRELVELPLDKTGVGAAGAITVVPRRAAERGLRVPDESADSLGVTQRGPLEVISRTGGSRGHEYGHREHNPHCQCSRCIDPECC